MRLLDLSIVLEVIIDALADRPIAQQQLVHGGHYLFAQVLAHLVAQDDAPCGEALAERAPGKRLAAIPIELAKSAPHTTGIWATVIASAVGSQNARSSPLALTPRGRLKS